MKTLPTPSAAPRLDRTYWVFYGKLLAGAYAGQPSAEAHLLRLNGLIKEGMRTVINLMEIHEKNNFGQPFTPYEKQIQELAASAGTTVNCYRFPIVDQNITTVEHMTEIVDAIDQSLSSNRPVYVHCFGGIGRTGTVVCCWLLRHGYADERNVFEVLKKLRQADKERASWPAPENDRQRNFVLEWFRQTGQAKPTSSKKPAVKLRDDWFTRLTGFSETSPQDVRENLTLNDGKLVSHVNEKNYAYGQLSIVPLGELRRQVEQILTWSDPVDFRLKLSETVGNVKQLHQDPNNAGALFQVASQFNLLEMVSPNVTPDQGVGIYEHDATQGPACAIACGAGTIYRNYFVPLGDHVGQSADKQVDCLLDIGIKLGNSNDRLWTMQNGYALPSLAGLTEIDAKLKGMSESELDELRSHLRVGFQRQTQVTLPGCEHLVSQVYCSAMPVAYSRLSGHLWERFARLILEAAYEATLAAAFINAQKTGNKDVYLTLLGGGAFGNDESWYMDAILRACELYESLDLNVKVVSYQRSKPEVQTVIKTFEERRVTLASSQFKTSNHHYCPVCGKPQAVSLRYPWHICGECLPLTQDSHGRSVEFFNVGPSGGLQWRYVGESKEALQICSAVLCLIRGRPVLVTEAHFGGIVAQPALPTRPEKRPLVVDLTKVGSSY